MAVALISTSPTPAIVQVSDGDTVDVNIPGKWQVDGMAAGWKSPDNDYEVVDVADFVVPSGKRIAGDSRYVIDEGGKVSQVYDVVDLPAPSPFVSVSMFRSLFSADELLAVTRASLTDETVRLMLDQTAADGLVDLSAPQIAATFSTLVSKGCLTNTRAVTILSYRLHS